MWTKELIERLKKYIDASRDFKVLYRGNMVYGMDLAPEQYPADQAAIYLEQYDDARPDNFVTPDETDVEDFTVDGFAAVEWKTQDPESGIRTVKWNKEQTAHLMERLKEGS